MPEIIDLNDDLNACSSWIAQFLKARGIDRIFGLQGGHIQPIWDHAARLGIKIYDVRDEKAAVHMAHAHAELTGTLGVAMATAGPGVTNTVTAIDVVTSQRAVSSDANKGLGFVPPHQALTAWDEAEQRRRAT